MNTSTTASAPGQADAAPAKESEWAWQPPAFLRVPFEVGRWLIVHGWRYRTELSPIYAGVALGAVAGQSWAWHVLLMVAVGLMAISVLIGLVRETHRGWLAYLVAAELAATVWTVTTSAGAWTAKAAWISWAALTALATGARWLTAWLVGKAAARQPGQARAELLAGPHPLQETIDDVVGRLMHHREALGLADLEIAGYEIVTENRFTVTVVTGRPARVLDQMRPDMMATLRLPIGMLRQITPVLDDAGASVWHFQVGAPHGGGKIWWKPLLMPGSVLEPIRHGVREDEEPADMVLATVEGGTRHGATSGKTGYGKTVHNLVIGAGVANCVDAVPLVCDLKGLWDFGPLAPRTPIYAWTAEQATRLLVALAGLCRDGSGNRAFLKRRGERVIVPGEDRKAIVCFLDEHRMVFSPSENPHWKEATVAAHTIAMLGRAYGISLFISGQDMSETAMPQTSNESGTAFRRQLHHRRVFHDDNKASGQFLLDDYARLDVSTLKTPGRFFHADGDSPSMPILGYDADPLTMHEWALKGAADFGGFDPATHALLEESVGDLMLARMRGIPAELAEWLPARTRAHRAHPVPAAAVPPSPEVAEADTLRRMEQQLAGLLGEEPPADLAAAEPLADPTLEAMAGALQAAGEHGTTRSALEQVTGKKRSWVGARLRGLAEAGVLVVAKQGRASRWRLAQGVDGKRLRSSLAEVDARLRGQDGGDGT